MVFISKFFGTAGPALADLLKPLRIGALICSMRFLSSDVDLYHYKATI